MNRADPKQKVLLLLTCVLALLALAPVATAVSGDEMEEPQTAAVASTPAAAAVTSGPAEAAVADEASVLHAQVVRGLPFSNFDLLAMCIVLLGLTILSYAVHRLTRDPAERRRKSQITTDPR